MASDDLRRRLNRNDSHAAAIVNGRRVVSQSRTNAADGVCVAGGPIGRAMSALRILMDLLVVSIVPSSLGGGVDCGGLLSTTGLAVVLLARPFLGRRWGNVGRRRWWAA
jgi:hypothetical protein